MKLEVNRLDMLAIAKKAAKVAPSNSPVEALNGVLIECDDDAPEVLLTAANHDTAIQCKTEASVSESGVMLINAGKLVDMLTLLSSERVEFSATQPCVLRVTGGRAVYNIYCTAAKHYPRPALPSPEETVKLQCVNFVYKKTSIAASKDDSKGVLRCVSVKINRGVVQAAACDGMKMMLVKGISESTETRDFLIPVNALGQLASISSDSDTYDVGEVGNEIVFRKENMIFSMKKLPGTFMDVMTVLKSVTPKYSALVAAGELRNILDSFLAASGDKPVNIALIEDNIRLVCDGVHGAMASSSPAIVKSATPSAGFSYNLPWLYKALQTLTGKVKLEMDEKGFMLIKSATEVYLQLPVVTRAAASPKKKAQKETPAEADVEKEAA